MIWPVPADVMVQSALVILAMMTLLWLWSVRRGDVSIVDPFWSIGFLVVTVLADHRTGKSSAKSFLILLVLLWSVRLAVHLFRRSRGQPEDPRYQAFRRHFGAERYWWFSYFQVFLLQGALLWLVSLPLQAAAGARGADPLAWNDGLGALLFFVGLLIEWRADRQLTAFRNDPSKRGQVLDTGLWRYSRHPNYFGEALLGWGFFLCALDRPGGWMTVISPVLMTYLLLRVSGVTLLERQLSKSKPGYEAYVRKTSAFVPLPPRERP